MIQLEGVALPLWAPWKEGKMGKEELRVLTEKGEGQGDAEDGGDGTHE